MKLEPIQSTPYLTLIPDRFPKQKVHTSLGHAKNAVSYRDQWNRGVPTDCVIYEWKDNEWVVLFEIPRGTRAASMPWKKGN